MNKTAKRPVNWTLIITGIFVFALSGCQQNSIIKPAKPVTADTVNNLQTGMNVKPDYKKEAHLPPADWNPLTGSDEELANYKYPSRPLDSDKLTDWKKTVTGGWYDPGTDSIPFHSHPCIPCEIVWNNQVYEVDSRCGPINGKELGKDSDGAAVYEIPETESSYGIILGFGTIDGHRATRIDPVNTVNGEQVKASTQAAFKISSDDIRKRYEDAEIKSMQSIAADYILVESQKETFSNRFDLYNLKTGEKVTLPTMPEYVTLEKAESENYFVFLSSGRNSESPFSRFPYLIKCFRIKSDIGKEDSFIAVYEEKYFSLDESVQAGSKAGSLLSDINITFDGFEVLFKPSQSREMDFYADATDIPPTRTSYDINKNQMIFEIGTDQLAKGLKISVKINTDNNQYISSYEMARKDDVTQITVNLRDTAKKYLAKIKRLPNGNMTDGFSVLSVKFAGKEN